MTGTFWLAVLVFAAATIWIIARIRRTIREREAAAQAREASLLAALASTANPSAAAPAPSNAPRPVDLAPRPARAIVVDDLAQQKLLFDSAHKAGEASEPALSIQLYARLLARYPASSFADAARAAIEAQKKKLPKDR